MIDETNGNNIINIPSHANLSSSNDDLSQNLSTPEQTDGEESTSAPTEYLAEVNDIFNFSKFLFLLTIFSIFIFKFLSAVMMKDYRKALKYCKLSKFNNKIEDTFSQVYHFQFDLIFFFFSSFQFLILNQTTVQQEIFIRLSRKNFEVNNNSKKAKVVDIYTYFVFLFLFFFFLSVKDEGTSSDEENFNVRAELNDVSENENDSECERLNSNQRDASNVTDLDETSDSESISEQSSPSKWNESACSSESEDTSYSYSNAMLEGDEDEGEDGIDSSDDSEEYEEPQNNMNDVDSIIHWKTSDLNNG